MDCDKYQKLLSEFIDAELSTEDSALLDEHLLDCKNCLKELQILQNLQVQIKQTRLYLRQPEVSLDFPDKVMRTIHDKQKKPIKSKAWSKIWRNLVLSFYPRSRFVLASGIAAIFVILLAFGIFVIPSWESTQLQYTDATKLPTATHTGSIYGIQQFSQDLDLSLDQYSQKASLNPLLTNSGLIELTSYSVGGFR